MARKTRIRNSMIDGVICAVILYLLEEYACSVYLFSADDWERDMKRLLLMCALGALLSAAVFWRLICRERDNGWLWAQFTISAVGAVVSYGVILLVLNLVLRIDLLPLRPLSNADGLILLFVFGLFVLSSLGLRLIAGFVQTLVNRRRKMRE